MAEASAARLLVDDRFDARWYDGLTASAAKSQVSNLLLPLLRPSDHRPAASGANQTDDSGSLLFVGPAKALWDADIFPHS
jgi:hypothetical protein